MQELATMVNEMVEEEKRKLIRLGVDLAKIRNSYFYNDLIAFIKGETENKGNLYFGELKPLYDEHGYQEVNQALLELDKESKTNE